MQLDGDKNFVINFSTDAAKKEKEKIYTKSSVKLAHRVPRDLFKGIFQKDGPHYVKGITGMPMFANENSPEELKDRIYQKYKDEFGISRDSLVFTYELPVDVQEQGKYNVIVLPTGDNDIAAQRNDVRITFLLEH